MRNRCGLSVPSASVAALLRDRSMTEEPSVAHTDPDTVDQPDRAGRGSRPARRQLALQVLLAVAIVALVYLVLLPKLVDVGEVWMTLRAMTWLELVTLLAAAVWNLVSYLLPQLVALPGLTP